MSKNSDSNSSSNTESATDPRKKTNYIFADFIGKFR